MPHLGHFTNWGEFYPEGALSEGGSQPVSDFEGEVGFSDASWPPECQELDVRLGEQVLSKAEVSVTANKWVRGEWEHS
ncbi:hypothetical protein [Deinococcus hohokamensis]|uniref:hypothetical protein n=1 Tax=Deinococcus hohokamensis TaxID=309883 RepID=UPI0036D3B73B